VQWLGATPPLVPVHPPVHVPAATPPIAPLVPLPNNPVLLPNPLPVVMPNPNPPQMTLVPSGEVPASTTTRAVVPARGRVARSNRKFFGDDWVNYQTSCPTPQTKKIYASILNDVFLKTLNWHKTIEQKKLYDLKQFLPDR
jgi:hypothetical protein